MTQVMSWGDWSQLDGIGLAALISSGELTAQEVAQQAELAVHKINSRTHAVVETFDDAIAAPSTDGTNLEGAFAGVPFLVKDLGIGVKGRLQEQGSLFMRGNRATEDAFLTQKMRQAGLNIIGRTTVPEFGVCSSAENPQLYVTRSPWNPDYTSFGSSAGASIAVAAGIVPLANGSDGGGSIRIPAGSNGLVGLKASRGVFSIGPAASDITGYVSTQGVVSRSVRDSALFFDQCRGGAPGEFMPYWSSPTTAMESLQRDPAPLRIALCCERGHYHADPLFVEQVKQVGLQLEALGHKVEWITPEIDAEKAFRAQTLCYTANFAQVVQRLLDKQHLSEPPDDLIEPINRRIWEQGIDLSYTERWKMQDDFNQVARQLGHFFEQWDIILSPTFAKPTPPLGERQYLTSSDNPDLMGWFDNLWSLFSFTPLANVTGTPGISLPMSWQPSGLPMGMHFHAGMGKDITLLQLAGQLERAAGGSFINGARPALHVTG